MSNNIISNKPVIDGKIIIKRTFTNKKPILNIYNNTMNEYAQNVLLGLSAGVILNGASPTPYNRLCFTTPGMRMHDSYGSSSDDANVYFDTYKRTEGNVGLTVAFLKLDEEELAALNSKSRYLPIKDGNGDISDKVVAYGVYKMSDPNEKTGVLGFSIDDNIIENFSTGNCWVFDSGKANFEYNAIAITSFDKVDSFAAYKCISKANTFIEGDDLTFNFIIPGFTGITGANEILLNYTHDGKSKWRYNLKTGVTTLVEENDPAYNIDMKYIGLQQVVLNNKLYSIKQSNDGLSTNNIEVYTSDGSLIKTITNISTSKYIVRGLFTDGTDLYVSVTKCSSTGSPAAMLKINQENYSFETIANTDFTLWGNLPSKFNIAEYSYIKASFVVDDNRYYVVGDTSLDVQFICSDLKNVSTSIVATAPIFDCVVNVDNSETGTFYICGGTKRIRAVSISSKNERSTLPMLPLAAIMDRTSSSIVDNTYKNKGVWINNNQFANFLSFEKFDTMQSKTLAQKLTVSYGYEIETRE